MGSKAHGVGSCKRAVQLLFVQAGMMEKDILIVSVVSEGPESLYLEFGIIRNALIFFFIGC